MTVVGAINGNLCLFRLARVWWRDDSVDGPGHGDTRMFRNSRNIKIKFRYSCGPGQARLRHFPPVGGSCRFAGFYLAFLMFLPCPHDDIDLEARQFHFAHEIGQH